MTTNQTDKKENLTNNNNEQDHEDPEEIEKKQRQQQILADRAIQKQQNDEYSKSLAIDKAKNDEKVKKQIYDLQRKERLKIIAEYRARIDKSKVQKNDSAKIRIMIRYPKGTRHIISLSADDSMETLFDMILSKTECPPFFFAKSIQPKMDVNCYPKWYQDVIGAELDEDRDSHQHVIGAMDTIGKHSIQNNSVIFVNAIN